MTIKRKSSLFMAAAITATLACSTAGAAIVQYTFDGGTYYDFQGGSSNTVTGSFDFDTVTEAFSNVTYNRGADVFTEATLGNPTEIYFGDTASPDYDVYEFVNPIANGGTDVITNGFHPALYVDVGGSITGTGAVPEPATWALMLAGVGLAGAMMRRRGAARAL